MRTKIQFKTALLAKEKGFNKRQKNVYVETLEHTLECGRGDIVDFPYQAPRVLENRGFDGWDIVVCQAPTQSVLSNWLLQEHGYFVSIELAYNEWGKYSAKVEKLSKDGKTAIIALDGFTIFDNPIDALEEGLLEALKLIDEFLNNDYES